MAALVVGAVLAIAAMVPSEPWRLSAEFWYEHLGPARRDTLEEELTEMRRAEGA